MKRILNTPRNAQNYLFAEQLATVSAPDEQREMPQYARDTSIENPWSVKIISNKFHDAVTRWPQAWVEGQVVEIKIRSSTVYFTIKDLYSEETMPAMGFLTNIPQARELKQGDRIIVHGHADIWIRATRLSFQVDELHCVGEGDLKKQIDNLRKKLKGEGLFDNKKPLPEIPKHIGIVCGPQARAESDIITNIGLRWSVNITVKHAFVQGEKCPSSVAQAIKELDADPTIDVIIVARGGGSFEDLCGFSNEALIRSAATCTTPIISAIGHEDDWTLFDLVADLRASTPTDAAKKVVPDVHEQIQLINNARMNMHYRITARLENEQRVVDGYAKRPILTSPLTMLEPHERLLRDAHTRMQHGIARIADDALLTIEKAHATITALSPQSTLNRGYAVVQDKQGHIVTKAQAVTRGQELSITVKSGKIVAISQ